MEVLVAVDRRMQEYHGANIQSYVLTLMSIVSTIYTDASIGNSINVVVVHVLLLKHDFNSKSKQNGKFFQRTRYNPISNWGSLNLVFLFNGDVPVHSK